MKTHIITAFLIFISGVSFAQNAWQDAVKLNEYFAFDPARYRAEIDNSVDVDEVAVMEIVAKYCPTAVYEEDGTQRVDLDSCFLGNPFISLRQYAQSEFKNLLSASFRPESEGPSKGRPHGGGLAGGSFVTNLADGLAIFLERRTKEELNATFFDGLRRAMEKEPTYKALFPATYDLLYVIGNEIYNYNAYLETLRQGFITDLKVLPLNVRQYSQDYEFIKKPEYRIALEDLLGTSQLIFDGTEPMEIIRFLSTSSAMQDRQRWDDISDLKTRKAMQDMAVGLQTFDLLVTSLTEPTGEWISSDEVSVEMRDITHVYLYLGLLWQQGIDLRFSNGTDFRGTLNKMEKMTQAPIELRNYLVELVQTGRLLEKNFKDLISKADVGSILNEEYFRFAGMLLDLLDQTGKFREKIIWPEWKVEDGKPIQLPTLDPETAEQAAYLEGKLLTILNQLFDLEFNIRQERYTMAVTNLTRFLEEVLNNEDFKYKQKFLKHVNFMANVAEARNAQEVAAAIELFALPPGSSRIKKQSPVSVSLNSYGGLAYGWENDFDEAVNEAIEDKNVLSTSAPLGIDLNFGLGNAGSISVYGQLIDVGAIFAYRFSNETESIPELKFQNIVAPGGYLIYGFGNNVPVSLGVGAQLGPNLRKIEDSTNLTVKTTNAWRFGFILSVDIPITHFYTK